MSTFRNIIAKGTSFPPEANRYHLYISLTCPFSSRCNIVRKLKGLESVVGMSITGPIMHMDGGWKFEPEIEGCTPDQINNCASIKDIYLKVNPSYSGSYSVPLLFDTKQGTIVNNEAGEIMRMLNSEFNEFAVDPNLDLSPKHLIPEMDSLNTFIYDNIGYGVYKCGLSPNQPAYDKNIDNLFNALDTIEKRLTTSRYLMGNVFTEADIRLFPTLARFDAAYYFVFKCNVQRIQDYPALSNYLRELYQMPKLRESVNYDHIKRGYFGAKMVNPSGVVARGPKLDYLNEPHNRATIGQHTD
ncbi:hypothetical protein SAMD00019534_006190 [Acytostelium subglobosum LB1]|uniref:hypothetical protein n=1 Tax=Acytostelium subglobosum LB1 TaxID=1410327 RepID=UPI000644DBFD|nr:hypothetical protein SAMD00019534_006190 [Acytostelium subglobosum LB1]GAM17444.1 hypothetical protein SAMD00019534_006190 [Acytostelium subglobosum LB1]|eukprot:XP_012759506.1 hypothetical protein SAMD00019534_006190 [Acytostelium subglobosum LB1]